MESIAINHLMAAAVAAVEKIVNINIADAALENLKENNYKLCFAKKVGDYEYNVVWESTDKYLTTNRFSWTPQYELFGTNTFEGNVKVVSTTKVQSCSLGELCLLNSAGILERAITGGNRNSLNFRNEFGLIHPGVNQIFKGTEGALGSKPIYVAENGMISGDLSLTPVEKVQVWFEQNISTSTMFSTARSNFKEVDLTSNQEVTLLFEHDKWSVQ